MDYTKKHILKILRNRAFCQRTAVLWCIAGVMGYMAGVLRCIVEMMGSIAVHSGNGGEYCGA